MWQPLEEADDLPRIGSIVLLAIDQYGYWYSTVVSWNEEEGNFSVSGQNGHYSVESLVSGYGWWMCVPYSERDWTRPEPQR